MLCLCLLLLWLYKFPFLGLTYFWDESWSYAMAIHKMTEGTPCLLPSCLAPELSRGHPLMYYFINAIVAKTFGFSPIVMHTFSLLIASFSIIAFFFMLLRFSNPVFALLGSLLLLTQEVFVVQSSFMLPEVFISFLMMTTIFFLVTGRIFLYIISATLLVLTKESGLVVATAAGIVYAAQLIRQQHCAKKYSLTSLIKKILPVLLPIIPGILFYVMQKATYGWYFFPLHVQMADFSWAKITNHLLVVWLFVFWGYGRKELLALLVVTVCLLLISCFRKHHKYDKAVWKLTTMTCFVFCSYTAFSAINFISLRYLIPLISLLIFLLTVWGYQLFMHGYKFTGFLLVLCIVFAIQHDFTSEPTWMDDVSINYADNITVQQAAIGYMESNTDRTASICTNYTMYFLLTQPELSALHGPSFSNVIRDTLNDNTDYYIFCNYPLIESFYDAVKSDEEFYSVKKFEHGNAWCEIFARK